MPLLDGQPTDNRARQEVYETQMAEGDDGIEAQAERGRSAAQRRVIPLVGMGLPR
jgi:hypothetical protein